MAKKKPLKKLSLTRTSLRPNPSSPPPRNSPSAQFAADSSPSSRDLPLVVDSSRSDSPDAKIVGSLTFHASESKSPKSSDLATVEIYVPREESHKSKECSLNASKTAETAPATHLSASAQSQNVAASASVSTQGQNDATPASTQNLNVAAFDSVQSQHKTAPTCQDKLAAEIWKVKGKKIHKRPHAPPQNMVYKPIVDQNKEALTKAKKISGMMDFPTLNNKQEQQVVVKGESSKSSITKALPVDLFSVSGKDLEDGEICVDLTGFGESNHTLSSSSSEDSLSDPLSGSGDETEDKPNDGHDKFIEVISKRFKRQLKYKDKSRARGPSTL
ncbi:hypothetical protein Bca101_010966 [Brassica carinata]